MVLSRWTLQWAQKCVDLGEALGQIDNQGTDLEKGLPHSRVDYNLIIT